MKYYSYIKYMDLKDKANSSIVVTISEQKIRDDYYSYWHDHMCYTLGKKMVEETYGFKDYLDIWTREHRAWSDNNADSN